jgi:hypothetical protein
VAPVLLAAALELVVKVTTADLVAPEAITAAVVAAGQVRVEAAVAGLTTQQRVQAAPDQHGMMALIMQVAAAGVDMKWLLVAAYILEPQVVALAEAEAVAAQMALAAVMDQQIQVVELVVELEARVAVAPVVVEL